MKNIHLSILVICIALLASVSKLSAAQNIYVPAIPVSLLVLSDNQNDQLESRSLPEHLNHLVPKIESPSSISPYIIGGVNTSRGEFPEFTQVFIDGQDGFLYAVCGATLISANKVLTAAHCSLEATNLYYVVPNFYTFNDSLAGRFISVSAKAVHPGYNDVTTDFDIAILTLSTNSISARANIYGGSNSLSGQISTVIGTGLINSVTEVPSATVKKVNTPIVGNSVCNAVYGSGTITNRMICAGFSTNGLGACSGDSGGPLWTNINGQRTQVGIASFGPDLCELPGVYTVYSRTSSLISFIQQFAPNANIIREPQPSNIAPVLQLLF